MTNTLLDEGVVSKGELLRSHALSGKEVISK